MKHVICCILCLLICGFAFSPSWADGLDKTKSKKRSLRGNHDDIFKYTNTQLTSLLKNMTSREVIARFGLPDRMAASVKNDKKTIYYKYGRTFTSKDKRVVFVNGKVEKVMACK